MSFRPNPFEFPKLSSRNYQEIEAVKSCTDTPAECTMFAACSGNGQAAMVGGACKCTCFSYYEGDQCEKCTSVASGWPRCRENCINADCNDHGTASGNKWKTEFGDTRDSCECTCSSGFAGDACDRCANHFTHRYPNCFGSKSPYVSTTGLTTRTTTTTPPPCRVNRGPIELMPPAGKNWLVLDCDVRLRDCQPDQVRCTNMTLYQTYCEWRNTTEFPTGQCLNKENGTYHARIGGTDREGEINDGSVNKSRLSVHRSSGKPADAPPQCMKGCSGDLCVLYKDEARCVGDSCTCGTKCNAAEIGKLRGICNSPPKCILGCNGDVCALYNDPARCTGGNCTCGAKCTKAETVKLDAICKHASGPPPSCMLGCNGDVCAIYKGAGRCLGDRCTCGTSCNATETARLDGFCKHGHAR